MVSFCSLSLIAALLRWWARSGLRWSRSLTYPGGPVVRQLLGGGQCHAGGDPGHGGADLVEPGEGRRQTDVAVARVVAARERGARRCQGDARSLGERHDARRGAVEHVEVDEVAAGRVGPLGDLESVEPVGERSSTAANFGAMIAAVPAHVGAHAVGVLEELDVAQVVDLVGADRAHGQVAEPPRHGGPARRERRDARAGEGDLRRRGEHDRAVGVPRGRGEAEDVGALGLDLGEVVEGVGVVPEDREVGRAPSASPRDARPSPATRSRRRGWRRSARSRCP